MAGTSCRAGSTQTEEPTTERAPLVAQREPVGEATPRPGRWRLADTSELNHVMLWVSHLLIRHQGSEAAGVSFSLAEWAMPSARAERSRDEALRLAGDIWAQAERGTEPFPALARRYSEDSTTRSRGGSLGGLTASTLVSWPRVLDALAAVKPGQHSTIVETEYGFHIFYLGHPPPEERISGAHIVIGHDQAPWLRYSRRSGATGRSRDSALARAEEVQKLAARDPSAFGELAARYSDHRDAAEAGDLGEWSSREPTPFPRELDVLRQLREGEISEPLETLFGIQILRRTRPEPRDRYAMTSIRIKYDDNFAAEQPFSKQTQRDGARSLLGHLLSHPEKFEAAQRQFDPGGGPESWTRGREPFGLLPILKGLSPDQIAPDLIEHDGDFIIVKRLAPPANTTPSVRFELPAPERPNAEAFVSSLSEPSEHLGTIARAAAARLELPADVAARLRVLHDTAPTDETRGSPEARLVWFRGLLQQSRELLGPAQFERYRHVLDEHVAQRLLGEAPGDERSTP